MKTNEFFDKLEKSGVNTKEFTRYNIILECLPDIVNSLVFTIQENYKKMGLYRHSLKYVLKPILDVTKKYIDSFHKNIANKDEVVALQYGIVSDKIIYHLVNNEELWNYDVLELHPDSIIMEYKGYAMCDGNNCTKREDCYRYKLHLEEKSNDNYYYIQAKEDCNVKIVKNNEQYSRE